MKKAVLSDLIVVLESGSRPKGGVSRDSGTIPSLGAEHLDGNGGISFDNPKYISGDFFKLMKRGHIQRDDILIVKDGATTGKVSFVDERFSFKQAAINEHVFRLSVNPNKVLPKYIYYYLSGSVGTAQVLSDFRGATVGGISQGFLDKVIVPLSEIPEQKQIVDILDKANSLRRKRKQMIQLLNDFLRATFIEMFGDPINNSHNYNVVTVGDITTHIKDGPHISPQYAETGVPILSTRNIRPGKLVLEDVKYLSQATYQNLTRLFRPQKGDVLVTKGGTTGYAKVVDFDWPFSVWVHIAVLRPKSEIDPLYLEGAMNSDYCYQQSQRYTHGIANRDLGLTRIAKIQLLHPPKQAQEKYGLIVKKCHRIRQVMQESSVDLDNQFNALMQNYFG